MNSNHNLLVGTVGGTLVSVTPQLFNATVSLEDVIRTALLAVLGTTVSFAVSMLLRYIVTRWKRYCR